MVMIEATTGVRDASSLGPTAPKAACAAPFDALLLDEKGLSGLVGAVPPTTLAIAMHSAWVGLAATGDPGWPTDRD